MSQRQPLPILWPLYAAQVRNEELWLSISHVHTVLTSYASHNWIEIPRINLKLWLYLLNVSWTEPPSYGELWTERHLCLCSASLWKGCGTQMWWMLTWWACLTLFLLWLEELFWDPRNCGCCQMLIEHTGTPLSDCRTLPLRRKKRKGCKLTCIFAFQGALHTHCCPY